MKGLSRLDSHRWALVAAVAVLLAAHGLAFYFFRHLTMSVTVALGLAVLVLIKHVGLLSAVYARFRKGSRTMRSSR